MLLPHEKNDMAVVGFAISALSIPLVVLGILCLFGVIGSPFVEIFLHRACDHRVDQRRYLFRNRASSRL